MSERPLVPLHQRVQPRRDLIAWGRSLLFVFQCFHTPDGNVELRCWPKACAAGL